MCVAMFGYGRIGCESPCYAVIRCDSGCMVSGEGFVCSGVAVCRSFCAVCVNHHWFLLSSEFRIPVFIGFYLCFVVVAAVVVIVVAVTFVLSVLVSVVTVIVVAVVVAAVAVGAAVVAVVVGCCHCRCYYC